MADLDFKAKYMELRSKFLKATDVAWKLGYEQGMKDSQVQQMQQQQMQQQQMAQMQQQAAMQGQAPQEQAQSPDAAQGVNQDVQQPDQQQPDSIAQDHLGQSIDELSQAVQKSEGTFLTHSVVSNSQKKALTLQKKIVDDVLKRMEEQAGSAKNDILEIVKRHK